MRNLQLSVLLVLLSVAIFGWIACQRLMAREDSPYHRSLLFKSSKARKVLKSMDLLDTVWRYKHATDSVKCSTIKNVRVLEIQQDQLKEQSDRADNVTILISTE